MFIVGHFASHTFYLSTACAFFRVQVKSRERKRRERRKRRKKKRKRRKEEVEKEE